MNKKGYTLLELLIVIFILGLILNIIVYRFEIIKKVILYYELEGIKEDIKHVKNKAISSNKSYRFQIDRERNSYFISTSKNGKIIKEYEKKLNGNVVKINRTNFPHNNRIIIKSTGVPNTGGTIYLKDYKGNNISIPITPVVVTERMGN